MQKKYLSCLLLLTLAGCDQSSAPFDVETFDRPGDNYSHPSVEVKVTATTDQVEILDIIVNRGNCKARHSGNRSLPHGLAFGESLSRRFLGPCSATQVDVISNIGEWTWTY